MVLQRINDRYGDPVMLLEGGILAGYQLAEADRLTAKLKTSRLTQSV